MPKIVYDKLIRDKVPAAIEKTGKVFATHTLSDDEYPEYLYRKLQEETTEFLEFNNISELADLVEVIHALVKAKGYTWDDLEKIRHDKAAMRGTFDKKLCLEYVGGNECLIILLMKNSGPIIARNSTSKMEDGNYIITLPDGEKIVTPRDEIESIYEFLEDMPKQ